MATFTQWIDEEQGSDVLRRIDRLSAVELFARREPMHTDSKTIPRSAGMGVSVIAKSAAYPEDTSTNDEVQLVARKIGQAIRIADEDMLDSPADIVNEKKSEWATSYAKFIDNAALGTNAAANGTTVPFTSVYKALTTTDAATSYTANANRVLSSTSRVVTYGQLSSVFGLVEQGDYFDESDAVVLAHTYFRGVLRGIVDSQNAPIFLQGLAGTPDTLFGLPVKWTPGAKVSATATDQNAALGTTVGTAGNPLLIVGSRRHLILGVRSGPESFLSNPHQGGPGQLTDEWILNMRARRGFAVGNPNAFAMLEVINA
jgi:HK97 family phage major capsid protein